MVPKVASFYWTGGPLPWLREQSLVTFRRLHPDWRVLLGSPEDRSAPQGVELVLDNVTRADLPPAARSDVWRYHALSKYGGLYADTDVLFVRRIEPLFRGDCDAWITQDMGTPVPCYGWRRDSRGKLDISIGVLAAVEGSRFFQRAFALAQGLGARPDYQSHGTRLLVAHWPELEHGLRLGALPAAAFYRGSSATQVRSLWREVGAPLAHDYGLHWYGGSPESAPFLCAKAVGDLPECRIRRALEA